MAPATGMATAHAQMTRPTTPQRASENRLVDATPAMDPAMVWVLETGMLLWTSQAS
jgi:hypothetical protein